MRAGRLYYNDPYLREFSAQITAIREEAGAIWVALSATAFYPEGGGQPADDGILCGPEGSWHVTDVQLSTDEEIVWHLVAVSSKTVTSATSGSNSDLQVLSMSHGLQVGDTVVGRINWKRRFDHMQQHCGQHILSQSFIQVAGVETVSFHLGEEYCSIDLDGTKLSAETVAAAEESANNEVMRAELIRTVWVDEEGAQTFRLRKKTDRQSDIRIVAIGEFDHSCCGGTHPGYTSEVQLIKVTGWEQTRGRTRVEFVCGNRAISNYQEHLTILRAVANVLGVHWRETKLAVTNLQGSLTAAEKSVADLKTNVASLKARSLLESATQIGPFLLVEYAVPAGNGPEAIRILGQQLVTQAAGPVIALLRTVGEKPYLVFVRNGRPGDTGPNLAELLRTLLEDLGGRGGGTPIMAQGGTPTPELATEIVSRAAAFLRKASALQEGW